MAKIIASINMTLNGDCDHTHGVADAELHDYYTALLRGAGALLYGRVTYQLMEDFWPTLVQNPSGVASMDDFALAIEQVPKVVLSRTLRQVTWANSTLAKGDIREVVTALRQAPGGDVYVGSPSLISALTGLDLIDEYHLCIHPVIAGGGMPLFRDIQGRRLLHLLGTKAFASGVVALYYAVPRD
jgi:dihydrofolate reductase